MKSLIIRILLCLIVLSCRGMHAQDCIFVTCINCPTDCDNREQFETCDGDLYGKTFFSFRPQDSDSSRRILGWFNADYRQSVFTAAINNVLTISPQYTRSFNPKQIAQWFFFSGGDTMSVGIPDEYESFNINGSQIGLSLGDDGYEDLVPGKIGTVWARPLVENYIIDLDYWHDLGSLRKGLWIRFEAPIVYMKTKMNMRACGHGLQADPYPSGLMTLESIGEEMCAVTPVPYCSILCALQGNEGWGAVEPLKYGKFPTCTQTKWGVAGLHVDLGFDFIHFASWYAAGSLQVVFPTGSRPQGVNVFEPVIGANKSWQIGATLIGNYIHDLKKERELGFYFYAVGTHLFKSKQDRVFAFKNNCAGSQLLLLKQFNANGSELINAERAANIFNGTAKIGSTLMFDGSFMMQFSKRRFVADLGYNFWARTKEKRSKEVCFKGFYENGLGIKGNLPMERNVAVGCPGTEPICVYDLNTDSTATIACSTNVDEEATFIVPGDIEYGSALSPAVMSHKVFAALGFKSSWFVLLSGEAEFGTNNTVINQWGVMLKIGKDF